MWNKFLEIINGLDFQKFQNSLSDEIAKTIRNKYFKDEPYIVEDIIAIIKV